MRAEPIGRGNPQHAFELLRLPGEASFDGECLLIHAFGMPEQERAFIGQDESARGPLEQRMPDRGFEGAQSPAHRRLRQRQRPRRRAQRSGAGYRQENAQVAPFHPQGPCLPATPCNCA